MKRWPAAVAALFGSLALASGAWGHAEITPNIVQAKTGQVFTLAVPTEKEDAVTTEVELTTPQGMELDSFVPTPGWTRSINGDTVVWSGGRVPADEAAVFQFVAETKAARDYTFSVRQTYSDGSVVDWSGPEDSDTPAPVVQAKSSLGGGGGGGGTSTVTWIALVLGGLGVLLAIVALAAGRRELA